MTLHDIVDQCGFEVLSGAENLRREVRLGYVADLMSDVLAHAEQGDLWITLQVHANIVAIAVMKELAGIVIIGGRRPEASTLEKAHAESVTILSTALPAFEAVGRLYAMGIRGMAQRAEGL